MSLPGVQPFTGDLTDEVNAIITGFNSVVSKIMKICRKIEPNMIELQDLQNKIKLAKDIDPLLLINRSKDKVWFHREQILNEDEDFFLNNQFSQFIKDDENKSFMYMLVNLVKKRYSEMSDGEKKEIWRLAKELLRYVVEYKKAINDHA